MTMIMMSKIVYNFEAGNDDDDDGDVTIEMSMVITMKLPMTIDNRDDDDDHNKDCVSKTRPPTMLAMTETRRWQ